MATMGLTRRLVGELHGIKAEIVYYQAFGMPTNAFAIHMPEERNLLSTRQGFKKARVVFNCYITEPLGDYLHDQSRDEQEGYREMLKDVLDEYALHFDEVTYLSTAIGMENMVWTEEVYEDLWVLAFATAGVKNNAMRIGKDRAGGIERGGKFKRFGTINVILLTNASLGQVALASSIITITEAKNVALQELGIRSSYNPEWLATGTGTDQVITVSGNGERCAFVQGHTKIGEMMAKAVTRSTIDAIRKSSESSD